MSSETTEADSPGRADATVIDCDVHQNWASEEEILEYFPPEFRNRGITPPGGPGYANPTAGHGLCREDSIPDDGSPPGSNYELLREQLFEDFGVDYALLTGPLEASALALHPNVNYATAAVEAYNDWLLAEWLDRDDRLLGAPLLAPHATEHAVSEIERLASHPQIAQVQLPGIHQAPYGQRQYWPIYEAAEAAGLPVSVHSLAGSMGVAWAPNTGAGIPGSYFEKYVTASGINMGELASLILEGVFVEFPDLDWVFIEQRLGWIPGLMWMMDQGWKGLRDQVPWLERRPSEYVRDNVWFTTQPVIEPEDPEHLPQFFEMMHAEDTLMFSTDYPHWDNDNPAAVLRNIPRETRRRIFTENAAEVYGI